MPLQNITITSSIKSLATHSYGLKTYIASTDEQSFPIEAITGSYAGAWPSFIPKDLNSTDSASNTTINLIVNVTQSWDGSNPTIYGYVPYVHNTMEEFINGEFSGSTYIVTNGNLTDDDCEQFLEYDPSGVPYKIVPYSRKYNDVPPLTEIYSYLSAFLNLYTVPNPGQMLMFYTDVYSGPGFTTRSTTINYLKIHRFDENGNNNTLTLQGLEKIIWIDSSVGVIELNVINRSEFASYYLFEVTSPVFSNILYFADDNVLDYTFLATASSTPIILSSSYSSSGTYHYLTSSWDVIYDTNNGFNISSGQYVFSSTPNIEVSFSASMSITLTNPATLSIAINAYDPALPYSIPNAVDSYPAPLLSSINTYGLSWGSTHSLFISGTVPPYPIQNYRYEVDFFITDLSGSGNNLHPYGPLVYAPLPDNRINNWSQFNLITPAQFTYNYWNQWLPYSIPASASDGGNSLWRQRIPNWVSVMYPTSSFVVGTINYPADEYMTSTNDYDELVPFGWISLGHLEPNSQRGLIYAFYNNYTSSIIDPYFSGSTLNNFRSSGSMLAVQVPANTYPPIEFTSSFQMGLSITIPPTFTSSLNGNGLFVDLSYGPPTDTVDIYVNDLDWNPSASNGYLGSLYSGSSGTFFFGPFTGSYIVGSKDSTTIFIVAPSSSRTAYFNEDFSSGDYGYHSHAFLISSMSLYLWPQTASVHNLSFEISQSFFPTQSATSSLIFEPFVYNNFYNTDCDVLMNNYSINDINNILQQVDYDFGSAVPSNIEQIIDGTAQRAQVNDYLYTSNANTRPRYIGTRTTSPNVNLNSVSGGYGVLPNVELTQTYFAYFDKLSSADPQLPGMTIANIKYLINSDGEIQLPSLSSSYYYNLIDNFISGKDVEVILQYDNTDIRESIGYKPVFRAGVFPKNTLGSLRNAGDLAISIAREESPGGTGFPYIVLQSPEFNIPEYYLFSTCIGQQIQASSQDTILYKNPFNNGILNYDTNNRNGSILNDLTDGTFLITSSPGESPSSVIVYCLVYFTVASTAPLDNFYPISLQKSSDKLNWETIDQKVLSTNNTGVGDITFSIPVEDNIYYRFVFTNNRPDPVTLGGTGDNFAFFYNRPMTTDSFINHFTSGSQVAPNNYIWEEMNSLNFLEYQPSGLPYGEPPSFPGYCNNSYGPFWITGSNSKDVLTSSVFYRYYNPEDPFIQRPYAFSPFEKNFSFNIKKGDYFGIAGDDTYVIEDIIANEITDGGLIDTNFGHWSVTGSNWSVDPNTQSATCIFTQTGGSPSNPPWNQYIFKEFNNNLNLGDVIIVEWELSNWRPRPLGGGGGGFSGNYALGFGVGINAFNMSTPTFVNKTRYQQVIPVKNGKHYRIIQKKTSPPGPTDKLFFTQDPYFEGTISNLKVNYMTDQTARLFLKLNKPINIGVSLNQLASFTISRFGEKSNFVVLDTTPMIGDGYLFPKYSTNELRQNFDNIATNLQKEGLI